MSEKWYNAKKGKGAGNGTETIRNKRRTMGTDQRHDLALQKEDSDGILGAM